MRNAGSRAGRKKTDAHSGTGQSADTGKRVLMLASVASMIDQFNLPNIKLLQDMGCEVHVVCNFRKGNTCDEIHIRKLRRRLCDMGVSFFQWDCPRNVYAAGMCMKAFIQLWRLTGEYRYDMMHCHSPVGGALARIVAHYRKIPVIYTAHGFHFFKGAPLKNWLLYYPAEKLLAYWTDVLITVNHEDYTFAVKNLKSKKTCRIPGVGIDTERFSDCGPGEMGVQVQAFRRQCCIPQDAFLLLSVGELSRRKNHRVVLDALARLRDDNVYYVICGQGKLGNWLSGYAGRLHIEKNIRFLGYVEHIDEACQAADVFIFPSRQEGLPVALMEAMAAGLPVIVSDIRGNTELVSMNGGRFAAPGDAGGFAREIKFMQENKRLHPEKIAGMGEWNQKTVRRFDKKTVMKKMENIYGKML